MSFAHIFRHSFISRSAVLYLWNSLHSSVVLYMIQPKQKFHGILIESFYRFGKWNVTYFWRWKTWWFHVACVHIQARKFSAFELEAWHDIGQICSTIHQTILIVSTLRNLAHTSMRIYLSPAGAEFVSNFNISNVLRSSFILETKCENIWFKY